MIRLFQIAVLSCAGLLLTGCNTAQKDEPIWQHTKIGDLAPSHGSEQTADQLLKTINFDVYVFEMPAENIGELNDVWQMLYTKPLQFNDYEAFCANSFLIGFGQTQMWDKIGNLLRTAGGKKIKTVSLLLFDGQANDLAITTLHREQDVYFSTGSSMEGVTIGPGRLVLRIKAEKIPGSRGVCRISALPVFSLPTTSSIPQLAARAKASELPFSCCRFTLKMSPGEFLFLGPEKYASHQITLDSLFFSITQPRPAVRMFLLVCASINY